MWLGKLIAAFLGFMVFGPIGAFLGLLVGHQFDRGYYRTRHFGYNHAEQVRIQALFFETTFQVMGHLAKVDGRVSENEIRIARLIMSKMGLNEAQRQEAIRFFNQGKQPYFNLEQALFSLKKMCHQQPILLHTFIEIQFQAAHADGHLNESKIQPLNKMCQILGAHVNFSNFNYGFGGGQSSGQHQRTSSYTSVDEAYALLGVPKTADDAEVKRAYRRQMSQNHPDKLVAKGLPEAMMKVATEKTQKIQAAYETICAARA